MSTDRTRMLRRAVAFQRLARDAALARCANSRRDSAALAETAAALARSSIAESPVHDLLVASIARRLTRLSVQKALLDEEAANSEATARRHAMLTRAGEKRLTRLLAEDETQHARRALEGLVETHAGRVSLG